VVVDDFQEAINCLAWKTTSCGAYFATSCKDKSVRVWEVIDREGHTRVELIWSSYHDRPVTFFEDVQDMSHMNNLLLLQHGATCA
jgi:WD40 repeat protein